MLVFWETLFILWRLWSFIIQLTNHVHTQVEHSWQLIYKVQSIVAKSNHHLKPVMCTCDCVKTQFLFNYRKEHIFSFVDIWYEVPTKKTFYCRGLHIRFPLEGQAKDVFNTSCFLCNCDLAIYITIYTKKKGLDVSPVSSLR